MSLPSYMPATAPAATILSRTFALLDGSAIAPAARSRRDVSLPSYMPRKMSVSSNTENVLAVRFWHSSGYRCIPSKMAALSIMNLSASSIDRFQQFSLVSSATTDRLTSRRLTITILSL